MVDWRRHLPALEGWDTAFHDSIIDLFFQHSKCVDPLFPTAVTVLIFLASTVWSMRLAFDKISLPASSRTLRPTFPIGPRTTVQSCIMPC